MGRFLKLDLDDSTGRVLSRNFYWLSTKPDVSDWDKSTWYYTPISSYADLTALSSLPRVRVDASTTNKTDDHNELTRVTLKNPSSSLAFFIHLEIRKGKDGEDVRPIYWQDNYISLLPGETREITANYAVSDLGGVKPVVRIDGWNVETSVQ
jgi:exo-1,4-beta-D-glucosaminidase